MNHTATTGTLPQESLLHNALSVLDAPALRLFAVQCLQTVPHAGLFKTAEERLISTVMTHLSNDSETTGSKIYVPALSELAVRSYTASRQAVMRIETTKQRHAAAHLAEAYLLLAEITSRGSGIQYPTVASIARHVRSATFWLTGSLRKEQQQLSQQITEAERLYQRTEQTAAQ